MQVAEPTAEALRAQIRQAFSEEAPTGELLLEPYRGSDDAFEMAAAFRGKRWSELPVDVLSYHREMLFALSAVGYRAYLPAYLTASLSEDERVVGEVGGHMLDGLAVWPTSSQTRIATLAERLSLLGTEQRAVVANVLRYLETTWDMTRAGDVLRTWT